MNLLLHHDICFRNLKYVDSCFVYIAQHLHACMEFIYSLLKSFALLKGDISVPERQLKTKFAQSISG